MTTIAALLFGVPPSRDAAIKTAFGRISGPLSRINVGGVSIPPVEVTNAVVALLELPMGNLAVHGWQQHRRVQEAIERTRTDPAGREVVELLRHKIRSKQQPTIDVDVDGVAMPILELEVEVELEVASAELVIERGAVSAVRTGPTRGKATLSASGVTLAQQQFSPVDATPELGRTGDP